MQRRRQSVGRILAGVALLISVALTADKTAGATSTSNETAAPYASPEAVGAALETNPDQVLSDLVAKAGPQAGGFDLQAGDGYGGSAEVVLKFGMPCGNDLQSLELFCINGDGELFKFVPSMGFIAATLGEAIRWVYDHWKTLLKWAFWIAIIIALIFILLVLCVMIFCPGAGVVDRVRFPLDRFPFDQSLSQLNWNPGQVLDRLVQGYYYPAPYIVGVDGANFEQTLRDTGIKPVTEHWFGPNMGSFTP